MDITVTAIVVTFNRRELLLECLTSLSTQSRAVQKIILIDNASTDDTQAALSHQGWLDNPLLTYQRLPANIGGAGGFNAGMALAPKSSSDWLWIMDDDCIPAHDALAQLLKADSDLQEQSLSPVLLASRIDWTDGEPHPMNFPTLKRHDWAAMYPALAAHCLPLRSTSFVSLLLRGDVLQRHALPIASYFIWNDDVEFTGRVLRREQGFLVGASHAVHKTREKYTSFTHAGERFFYEVRNKLWMIRRSTAWSRQERLRYLLILLLNIRDYFRSSGAVSRKLRIVARGFWHGLTKSP